MKKNKYKYITTLEEWEIVIKLNKEKKYFLCVSAYVIILTGREGQEEVTCWRLFHLESALLAFK